MKKSSQVYFAFGFGVTFVVVMLLIAVLVPYPSKEQFFTFRIVLGLAAGGVAAMLPGFIVVNVSTFVRAGGALAAFAVVYFFNPPLLSAKGMPTDIEGIFIKELPEENGLAEFYWKQANMSFRFPKETWTVSTKAASVGLGDLHLESKKAKDIQIQLHVSALDEKYRNDWEKFKLETTSLWQGTISQFGDFRTDNTFIDGRQGFVIRGTIKGSVSGLKVADLVYAPIGDNRLIEVHFTRNRERMEDVDINKAYQLVLSTVRFDRSNH
jgi:hypothetical protein